MKKTRYKEIVNALRIVATKKPQKEHLLAWTRHAVLNLGVMHAQLRQARTGYLYNGKHLSFAKRFEEVKDALQSFVFAIIPPTHHKAKEMEKMLQYSHRSYFRYGTGKSKNPELKKIK